MCCRVHATADQFVHVGHVSAQTQTSGLPNLTQLNKATGPSFFNTDPANGPVNGTPVEHRVCVVGLDWLAADRVGLELMGVDPAKVGYLTYCGQMGMGEYDLAKIEVVGDAVKNHAKTYRLSASIERQLQWMNRPAVGRG